MNSTTQLEEEITSKFCAFNTTDVTNFMEALVPQLDIGSLVQKVSTLFLDGMDAGEEGSGGGVGVVVARWVTEAGFGWGVCGLGVR